jgi:peptidoglycan glycosyltransferase
MFESLTQLLNGPDGVWLLKGMKAVFLGLLALSAFSLFVAPTIKRGKTSYTLLRLIFVCALLAVLCYQTYWQLFGFTNPRFAKFIRRYNRRPNAAEIQILRGPILDRRGFILAAPVLGDIWGRRYPLGEAAVHPIGYYHSTYGITAVERVDDPVLSGYDTNDDDKPLTERLLTPRAKEGREVQLTLDFRLQQFAYDKLGRRKGAVVVLLPRTGELLALVSSPGFDPLAPEDALADDKNQPAFNRAVQGLYPPGSTFKLLVAGTALDLGCARSFNCPGAGYVVGPSTPAIRDSEYYAYARVGAVWQGWGDMTLHDAIVHSSNVYFAQLGVHLGTDAFNMMTRRARINDSLRYFAGSVGDLRTAKGSAPAVEKPRLLAQPAIGQGQILVTPLHVACWTAAVAADGVMPLPRLGKADTPEAPVRLYSQKSARVVRGAMRDAVIRGTGKTGNVPGLDICGKTGTAQAGSGEDHAWFTCFAPERDPQVVVTVLVEHGGFGAKAALPVAVEVLKEADRLGYVRRGKGGRDE